MLRTKKLHAYVVAFQAFLLFSNRLESASYAASLALPSVKLKLVREIPHRDNIESFVFSFEGNVVATNETRYNKSNYGQCVINVWNAKAWTLQRTFSFGEALGLSSDGRALITKTDNNAVLLFDTKTGKLKRALKGFRQNVVVSPNGRLMAGKTRSGAVGIWNTSTGKRLTSIRANGLGNFNYFSPDNKLLANTNFDANATNVTKVFKVATGKLISSTRGFGDASAPIVFSPDKRTFLSAGTDPNWKCCPELPQGQSYGDGGCPVDYAFKLWDVDTGKLVKAVKGARTFSDPYAPRAFLQHGKQAIYSTEYQFDVRSVTNGKLLYSGLERSSEIPGPRQRQAISPDGSLMLEFVGFGDSKTLSTLCVWKIQQ